MRAEHEREAHAAESAALRKRVAELEGEVERLRAVDRSPDPCKISLIESDLISSIEHQQETREPSKDTAGRGRRCCAEGEMLVELVRVMNAYESVQLADGEGVKRLVRDGMKALIELEETKLFIKQVAWELDASERSKIIERIKELKRISKDAIADREAFARYKEQQKNEDTIKDAKATQIKVRAMFILENRCANTALFPLVEIAKGSWTRQAVKRRRGVVVPACLFL